MLGISAKIMENLPTFSYNDNTMFFNTVLTLHAVISLTQDIWILLELEFSSIYPRFRLLSFYCVLFSFLMIQSSLLLNLFGKNIFSNQIFNTGEHLVIAACLFVESTGMATRSAVGYQLSNETSSILSSSKQ